MRASLVFLAALAVGVAGCGGSSSTPSSPTSPSSPAPTSSGSGVTIVAGASTRTTTAYNPNPITVSRGGTVTWVNNDNTTHTSAADGGAFNSGNIAPGGSFSQTFQSAGSFTYHCAIHPNMVGTVTVQ
jgi:plastocyanin